MRRWLLAVLVSLLFDVGDTGLGQFLTDLLFSRCTHVVVNPLKKSGIAALFNKVTTLLYKSCSCFARVNVNLLYLAMLKRS